MRGVRHGSSYPNPISEQNMLLDQGLVAQGADNVIQWINRYSAHTNTVYPMDCDLSTGPDLENSFINYL